MQIFKKRLKPPKNTTIFKSMHMGGKFTGDHHHTHTLTQPEQFKVYWMKVFLFALFISTEGHWIMPRHGSILLPGWNIWSGRRILPRCVLRKPHTMQAREWTLPPPTTTTGSQYIPWQLCQRSKTLTGRKQNHKQQQQHHTFGTIGIVLIEEQWTNSHNACRRIGGVIHDWSVLCRLGKNDHLVTSVHQSIDPTDPTTTYIKELNRQNWGSDTNEPTTPDVLDALRLIYKSWIHLPNIVEVIPAWRPK